MANDINKVILVGRLVRDPELKMVGSNPVANFTLANNKSYKTKDGQTKEDAGYFECEAWGRLAEVLNQYAKKGKQVLIDGRLRQNSWEGPDGKRNSKIRIQVENFQLLGGAPSGGGREGDSSSHSSNDYSDSIDAGDYDRGSSSYEDDPF